MLNKKVMKYFESPINMEKPKEYDLVGEITSEECCDLIRFYVVLNGDLIEKVMFESNGCAPAIASSCAVTVLYKEKKVEEALKINYKDIINFLGGLPKEKEHCAILADRAIKNAIKMFRIEEQL